jgi:hypothetical protein
MENTSTAVMAASTPHAFVPPTKLGIGEWTARFQDALAETAPVGELVVQRRTPDTPPEPRPRARDSIAGSSRRIYRPSMSGDIECSCGCGDNFGPTRAGQRFKSATHARRAQRTKAAA